MYIFFEKCIFVAYVRVLYRFLINIFKCNFRKCTPLLIIFNLIYHSIFFQKIYSVPQKNGHINFTGCNVKKYKHVWNFVHSISKNVFFHKMSFPVLKSTKKITIIDKIRLLGFPVLLKHQCI